MIARIVTGWSPSGWAEYAHRFLSSFDRFWPPGETFMSYTEHAIGHPRLECRDLLGIREALDFLARHNYNRAAHGKEVAPTWKASAREIKYNWRYDAAKFCRQVFIIADAARDLPDGAFLCWLDADVVTHAPCSAAAICGLMPERADLAFLGRGAKFSEIGFQLYRLGPASRAMLEYFSGLYASDEIFRQPEWHSGYAFDVARRYAQSKAGLIAHDLTPGGRGHVWHDSPLARWLDHLKGDRKQAGRSPERR